MTPSARGGSLVRCSSFAIIWLAVGLMLAGCGSFTKALHSESAVPPVSVSEVEPATVTTPAPPVQTATPDEAGATLPRSSSAEPRGALLTPIVVAQAPTEPGGPNDADEEYDPWESFYEKMFTFNYYLDKYLLKPAARGYRAVMPEQV